MPLICTVLPCVRKVGGCRRTCWQEVCRQQVSVVHQSVQTCHAGLCSFEVGLWWSLLLPALLKVPGWLRNWSRVSRTRRASHPTRPQVCGPAANSTEGRCNRCCTAAGQQLLCCMVSCQDEQPARTDFRKSSHALCLSGDLFIVAMQPVLAT